MLTCSTLRRSGKPAVKSSAVGPHFMRLKLFSCCSCVKPVCSLAVASAKNPAVRSNFSPCHNLTCTMGQALPLRVTSASAS